MRTWTALLSMGCLAAVACDIPDENPGSPDRSPSGETPCAGHAEIAPAAPTPVPIKRLAKVYFQNAVGDFLTQFADGPRAAMLAAIQTRLDLIPADNSAFYSTNDDTVLQDHVDAIFGLAVKMASVIGDESTGFASEMLKVCGPGKTKSALDDDGCLTTFVQHYGRKTLRRPLLPAEIEDFKATYRQAGADGMAALVGRFIAHPSFYYRFDADGEMVAGAEGQDAVYRLTKWELLSKITFLFWAAPPTSALYERVAKTDITEDEALKSVLDDVLADPKAEQGVLGFYREWLLLDHTQTPATEGNVLAGKALVAAAGLDALPIDHRQDMIQEVLDLAKHYTLTTEGKVDDILTSTYSFAKTPALAKIYGVAPWDGTPDHLVTLPAGQRSGLLTRAAMVASNTQYTRPIIKGKRILTQVLCRPMSPPPASLDIRPLVHVPEKTTRQVTEDVTGPSAAQCNGCHKSLNPLGYLTESYDPLGRFRTEELRFSPTNADVLGRLAPDTKAVVQLAGGSKELADGVALSAAIAASGEAQSCLVQNYFQYVTGRQQDPKADACAIAGMQAQLTSEGGSIKNMLRETVLQQSFRQRKVK